MIAVYDDAAREGTMWLVNPVFVLPNWNDPGIGVDVARDGRTRDEGTDYLVVYELTEVGTNLVVWVRQEIDANTANAHLVGVTFTPRPQGDACASVQGQTWSDHVRDRRGFGRSGA